MDQNRSRISTSATIAEGLVHALETAEALTNEGLSVAVSGIAGTGFEPVTFGL